ncbi:MAG: hypothetical protein KC933_32925, partial [Myxococcales bacterium]|nr:hypothetical protein [Myxococcales bacterium]
MGNLIFFATIAGIVLLVLIGFAFMVAKFYRKVEQGRALIINKVSKEPEVTFTGGLVLPIVHRAEVMDISVKTIEIDRRGKEGLICKDNIRADIKVTFFVKVNKTTEDVLKVAQQVGCVRASDQGTLEELFNAKFSEALKTVGKQLDFVELYTKREDFKDEIVRTIGRDLNGYVLDDAAIDYLEQTPVEVLDKDNILDAHGIRKITDLTTQQNIQTNELRQAERKAIKKQNVEAEEAVLALIRQEEEAKAKQAREIASVKAREEAEAQKIQAEEFRKAQLARIKTEEDIKVTEEAKERQVQVAQKNRERVIAIETERVEKDRMLEQISRERETELNRIQKEKEVEVQKKEIADVIRGRIAVEKTVAEEEERIKDTRAIAEAKRNKEVQVTAASAQAEEKMISNVKAAEAQENVARHKAKEKLTLADADLEAADRTAKAKIRLAEGVQAEVAAEGLAKVKVREADAIALEKEGGAKARVTKTQMEAEAQGKMAEADAVERRGLAEATVVQKQGEAEAVAIEKKLTAEAKGLAEKADAMKALDGVGREHEEFRLRLEKDKQVELAHIEAQQKIADARAAILKEAFAAAKINIVGGDGQFFDRFVNAVSVGKSVDGFVDQSDSVQQLFGKYLGGGGNLPGEVLQAIGGLSTKDLQNLSISGLLGSLMVNADDQMKGKLETLLEKAQELGVDT